MNSEKKKLVRKVIISQAIIILVVVNCVLVSHLDTTFAIEENAHIEVQKTALANQVTTTVKPKDKNKSEKLNLSEQAKAVAKTEKKETLILVNSTHALPDKYKVELSTYSNQGKFVATRILKPLTNMLKDGEKKGLSFVVCSAYRDNAYQKKLFDRDVAMYESQGYSPEEAKKKTAFSVQPSGYSEHATGYAVDIISEVNENLDKTQEETEEFKWLKKNCYKYGFILRYPDDKSKITKIIYEPWHFRYVGKKVAKFITENKLTFEEFTDLVNQ